MSKPARARQGRFFWDAGRPKGAQRIFALSDVHFDQKANEEWCHGIDSSKFQEDILIIAGGVADTYDKIIRGLTTLKGKFRRVFYQVGCNELWIPPNEKLKFTDSMAKMLKIYETCDEIGIDTSPAQICQDVFLVPMAGWYNAQFDEKDPMPDPNVDFDPMCKWPIDRTEQVWRFMLKMNESRLQMPYHGDVITFSHVLPRYGLPFWDIGQQIKFIGCTDLDAQARSIGTKLHVYGRSHRRIVRREDEVVYVNMPLGKPDERQEEIPPLQMVHDGWNVTSQLWGIWDGPLQQ